LANITAEDPETVNAVSYAGRKNRNPNVYPGLFEKTRDTSTTTVASDDFEQPTETPWNHPDVAMFLFLDGHADDLSRTDSNFLDMQDPLTN
jgi:prepilin-type processing-associated H-X9-DG protein